MKAQKQNKERKEPRILSISNRIEGTTAPMCRDCNVAEKWIKWHHAMGQELREKKIGRIQKTLYSWWKRTIAYPVAQIDDNVKHLFREHNQEAEHLENLGAEGQRKITIEKGDSTENSKTVRGFWDGSTMTDVRSGCGVVIKGVDKDKWITLSGMSVPFRTCTAMAAEVAGASVLIGILDLVLENQCGKHIFVH